MAPVGMPFCTYDAPIGVAVAVVVVAAEGRLGPLRTLDVLREEERLLVDRRGAALDAALGAALGVVVGAAVDVAVVVVALELAVVVVAAFAPRGRRTILACPLGGTDGVDVGVGVGVDGASIDHCDAATISVLHSGYAQRLSRHLHAWHWRKQIAVRVRSNIVVDHVTRHEARAFDTEQLPIV